MLLIFLFFIGTTFSQSDIFYFKDANSSLTYKNIAQEEFNPLEKEILKENLMPLFGLRYLLIKRV
ncbi:hypothetical protein LPB303_15985 [Polaribacter atrinae]|uniref:Uncharacterized protein n=1 Tax=Polaribacter atrinae TaxID=1333662 RepID=A0A176SZA0_9FLAO|nr:hypothetical protein LPB303_15985 [Polaribacter atrinae]